MMGPVPDLAATVETCPNPLTSPHRSPICATGIEGSDLVAFFAATVPGLGPLLRDEAAADQALKAEGEPGFDGRADIVFFSAQRGARFRLDSLRLAEDVFAVIAGSGGGPVSRVAETLVSRDGLERALSVWANYAGHLSPSMTFRVITRVVDERRFQRTELRSAVERAISASRPRWRLADPADLEVWVVEHHRARFISGLRLSGKRMRQHGGGRASERPGALRPVVAAAMVRLAGPEAGRLLDPCCGSGTIASEAVAAGWKAWASDIDDDAVRSAAANVPQAVVRRADARDLPYRDGEFDAVVTNVPFGRQFRLDEPSPWMRSVLGEAARVTRPGGRVVVLAPPPVPRQPAGLVLAGSYPLRVLGVSARIWAFDHR
jgi:23S rRNA G2445 N2-methylase RlmL